MDIPNIAALSFAKVIENTVQKHLTKVSSFKSLMVKVREEMWNELNDIFESIKNIYIEPDMKKIINGGPLTLELHDSIFRNSDSVRKVSHLVKSYMDMGGQQLQINAVNRDQLIEAKKHPELHKNLIVRVWGWSGYFVELDEEYQDHIIQRVELSI